MRAGQPLECQNVTGSNDQSVTLSENIICIKMPNQPLPTVQVSVDESGLAQKDAK